MFLNNKNSTNTKVNDNVNREEKHLNWPILLIVSLGSFVMGIYRDGIAALFPFFQSNFGLTRAQLGLYISSIFFVAFIVSIFSGRLVDLKGSKWGITSGMLLVSILLILHSVANNFITLLILASFAGVGISINSPASNKGITELFPKKWWGTAMGIWSSAFPIGALIAAISLPLLGILFGWRKAIIVPGILSLLCVSLVGYFYPIKKSEENYNDSNKYNINFWKAFGRLINNNDLLAISIYGFFLGSTAGAIATHFTIFLYLDYGLSEKLAGFGFAFVHLGSIIGRPIWGLFCDKFLKSDKRKCFLFISILFLLLAVIFSLFLKSLNPSLILIFLLSFLIGYSGRGWHGLFFSSIPEMVEKDHIGVATGFSVLFIRMGILLSPPIFGYIADTRNSYDLSWLFLGLLFFLASVGQYIFYIKHNISKNI